MQRSSKVKSKTVKKCLNYQDVYSLHKSVRHSVKRRHVISVYLGHKYQADLIDLRIKNKLQRWIFVFREVYPWVF